MNALGMFLETLEVGVPLAFADGTLVPLLAPAPHPALDVDLLEEGVREGRTVVTEVGLDGRVNEILVEHSGTRLLLLVDGEQVIGAKQNRIVNASFLVPPGARVSVPVSCVEKGRWQYASRSFEASESTIAPSIRAQKLKRVTTAVRETRGYDAGQRETWAEVDTFLEESHTQSRTSSYADGIRADAARIEGRLEELRPIDRQVGLALLRNGVVTMLEVFGAPVLFAKAWKKIARGLLVELHGIPARIDGSARDLVRIALHAFGAAPQTRTVAPGCGESLHAERDGTSVGAISYEGTIFHLVAAAS